MQGVCRVVGKLVLEIAKSNGALVKIFGGLHLLQAHGVLHEVIDTPTTAVGGLIIGLSSFGQRNMERGTFRVSPRAVWPFRAENPLHRKCFPSDRPGL